MTSCTSWAGRHQRTARGLRSAASYVFLWIVVAMASALVGCVKENGTCEEFSTCSCGEPLWASSHPELCPASDGGGNPGVEDAMVIDAVDGAELGTVDSSDVADTGASRDGGDASAVRDVGVVDADGATVRDAGPDVVPPPPDAAPDVVPCDPTVSPAVDTCVVDERYGVFVTPTGNDMAAGSRAAPLRTLAAALSRASTLHLPRIYACDGGASFAETLRIDANVSDISLFGGFSCPNLQWSFSATHRAVIAPNTGSALIIRQPGGTVLMEDFDLEAPDAAAVGASSIAAIVDRATTRVVFRRVRVVAGRAADGAPGAVGTVGEDGAMTGDAQDGLDAVCGGAPQMQAGGRWPVSSSCGSLGGAGGGSTRVDGSRGDPGMPQDNVAPPGVDNSGSAGSPGVSGNPGSAGIAGDPGDIATSVGTFTNTGFTPAPRAGAGGDGHPGQGGGGGGASNSNVGGCVGASGGAGGMGGCGGQGGTGGTGGGASIAVLVWMTSDILFDACELVSGEGGAGGRGANGAAGGSGQPGGIGGAGTSTVRRAGAGGQGGDGGPGGPGAGGNGGPSYALAFSGPVPNRTPTTTFMAGGGGPGGAGGTTNANGNPITAPTGTPGDANVEFSVP
jgi:hypothetical protein